MPKIPELEAAPDVSLLGDMTLEQYRNDFLRDVEAEYLAGTGKRVTLPRGDKYRMTVDAVALKLFQAELRRDHRFRMQFLKYAMGEYLDLIGSLYRLPRRGIIADAEGNVVQRGFAATVTVRFTLSTIHASAYQIPIGTRIRGEEEFLFFVSEYAEIPRGEISVDVRCEAFETGTAGNGFAPGTLKVLVDPLPYMEKVENVNTSAGGEDVEGDEDYRWRIYYSRARFSTAGALEAYEYWARQYRPDIETVWAFSPTPCYVTVLALLRGGVTPDQEFLSGLYEFLSDKDKRPLSDRLTVAAPREVDYAVDVTVCINAAYASTAVHIRQEAQRAAERYVQWQRVIKRDITPGMLVRYLHEVPGLKRCAVASPAADVVIDDRSIARLTSFTVNYGGLEAE